MKTLLALALGIALLFPVAAVQACGPLPLKLLAPEVLSDNPAVAAWAVEELRTRGPAGLAALVTLHDETVHREFGSADEQAKAVEAGRRLRLAIDAVGGQRDCHASRLYWYTDLD